MKKINRKQFLKGAAVTAVGLPAVLTSCASEAGEDANSAPNIQTQKTHKWKMVTTWSPNFPVMGEGCEFFADWAREMSNGQLDIKVYGAGELVPAFEAFDAVSSGTAEIGSGASYYWAGKAPAAQFFASVPFGMNAQQMNAWIISGGGLDLWKELYADFNLIPIPAGNTGVQMGGWFNREINNIGDLKGLKMRIPGLGGNVLEKAGGTAVLVAGGEIYTNLERGVIDATEWIGPYHDYKIGFHKIAKYYYTPGWHEPGTILEIFVNKNKYDSLPKHLREILIAAAMRQNVWTLAEFEAKNAIFLRKMMDEENVDVRNFPEDVLSQLRDYTDQVIAEITTSDPMSFKVYESYRKFKEDISDWAKVTEKVFYNSLQT